MDGWMVGWLFPASVFWVVGVLHNNLGHTSQLGCWLALLCVWVCLCVDVSA
jgi:hypothetical protein